MKQPEELKLAIELIEVHNGHTDEGPSTFSDSAAELRRMHEVNQELLKALKKSQTALSLMLIYHGQGAQDYADVAQVRAQDANDGNVKVIEKAGGAS